MRSLKNLLLLNRSKGGGIKAAGNTIELNGPLVSDDLEAELFGGISLGQLKGAIAAVDGDVHLRINSPGGDVFAARAMAQAIREHDGDVVAHVDGVAASAASLIVMAATRAVMAPGALLMIHDSWTMTVGNAGDHAGTAELLAKVDGTIAATYASKGKGEAEDYVRMMAAETWFTGDEALAEGLVDEVIDEAPKAAVAARAWDLSAYSAAPYRAEIMPAPEPGFVVEPEPEPEPLPDPIIAIESRRRRLAARLI